MTGTLGNIVLRSTGFVAGAAFLLSIAGAPTPASAQQGSGLGSVLGGAAVGAIVGGAIKGGKGAAVGAGVGAAVGAAAAANARNNTYAAPPPRRYRPAPYPQQPVYSNNLVYNVQLSLTKLGYNPGPVDGVYGQQTADAVAAYEYNNQLPVTGQVTDGVYYHMKQAGG